MFIFTWLSYVESFAIGILSHPNNYERRQAMRQSWLQPPYAFVIGIGANEKINQLVEREAEFYQDIILMPEHLETYRNLTYKTLRMMRWAVGMNINGLLKVDDDTWVDLGRLREAIRLNAKRSYVGVMQERALVERRPANRHYVSPELYAEKHFPPFALGWGYYLGISLIQEMLELENKLILPVEDVSVGVWLTQLQLVYRIDLDRKSGWIMHHLSADEIRLANK